MPKLQDELKTRARLEKVIREFNLYPKIVEKAPVFADYQAKTTRSIPLFELTRV